MDGKLVTYQQFLEGYKAGEIMILVNKAKAGDFVLSEFADKHNKPAHLFWTWAGLIVMIPLPIILWIYQGWVYAVGSFILGSMINSSARKSAEQFVLENILKDKAFWIYVLLYKGAIMQDKEGNEISPVIIDGAANDTSQGRLLDMDNPFHRDEVTMDSHLSALDKAKEIMRERDADSGDSHGMDE